MQWFQLYRWKHIKNWIFRAISRKQATCDNNNFSKHTLYVLLGFIIELLKLCLLKYSPNWLLFSSEDFSTEYKAFLLFEGFYLPNVFTISFVIMIKNYIITSTNSTFVKFTYFFYIYFHLPKCISSSSYLAIARKTMGQIKK